MCDQNTTESTIMAALSTLSSTQISSFSLSLSSTFHRQHLRLSTLLSSPVLFSHALDHLFSLSLPQKSLLIARHLLSTLRLLVPFLDSPLVPNISHSNTVRLKDLDSALLLLFFCEVRSHCSNALATSPTNWHIVLKSYCSDTMLNLSGFIVTPAEALVAFVDTVVKCRRFVGGGPGREVAAAVAVVVALRSVVVESGGVVECVICKEEMREGRDVCELPCKHLFHWMCVIPWLRKCNTCPCCRFRLPSDDVYAEIERLWEIVVKVSGQHFGSYQCN